MGFVVSSSDILGVRKVLLSNQNCCHFFSMSGKGYAEDLQRIALPSLHRPDVDLLTYLTALRLGLVHNVSMLVLVFRCQRTLTWTATPPTLFGFRFQS